MGEGVVLRQPARATWRRLVYFALVWLTTLAAMGLLTAVFLKDGATPLELLLMLLYTLLILWVSAAFWTATLGFGLLLFGGDPRAIGGRRRGDGPPPEVLDAAARTAVVMPIYNEDPDRVFAGLRAIYQSLSETGALDSFDFFVLSDTRDPDLWIEEEVHWYRSCQALAAHGRIFYRNRERNTARKSGNIADFVRRWGGNYRYMVVLDADSLMSGATIVELVRLMESHPGVAVIQSPPLPVHRESLFARILQFASSLYSGMFVAGLAFWQLADSTSWGHNLIIRIAPFAAHCGLPRLGGREPFGGEILSHDFVEAALLRRAGFEVWLAPALGGSYEELPPTLIDYAKRDRRWCQGNLQHLRMLFARGFSAMSRLHLLMGIMSYLSSPLWLLFLVVTGIEAYVQSQTEPVYFFGDTLFPVWPESVAFEMTTVLVVTLTMLFLPKLLGLILLARYRERRRGYGGWLRAGLSVVLESAFSALIAPILMLYQSKFVAAILLRRSIGWPAQQRGDHRLSLCDALHAHWDHTLIGVLSGALSYAYLPGFFFWLTPVLVGLWLSIPISIASSSIEAGRRSRAMGLFWTPEERDPPRVTTLMREHWARIAAESTAHGSERVLVDPAVLALHTALIPERPQSRRRRYHLRALIYQALEEGAESLSPSDRRDLLSDPQSLSLLHTLTWSEGEIDPRSGEPRLAAMPARSA